MNPPFKYKQKLDIVVVKNSSSSALLVKGTFKVVVEATIALLVVVAVKNSSGSALLVKGTFIVVVEATIVLLVVKVQNSSSSALLVLVVLVVHY